MGSSQQDAESESKSRTVQVQLSLKTPNNGSSSHVTAGNKLVVTVRYRECQKNHAAAIGGNATDGCGEFMPSGEEATIDALKCSACSCHRNFHRKEVEHETATTSIGNDLVIVGYLNPSSSQTPIMASEISNENYGNDNNKKKKRFRTKFTVEQKERMVGFADKVGWKIQKLDHSVVQNFCIEIGIKRRVLKVWMHNNKHMILAKKTSSSSPSN